MPQVYAGASDSIVTALTSVATQATEVIGAVAPVAITVMGLFLIWKVGIRFFKSVAKG